jgi:hypothetical protein
LPGRPALGERRARLAPGELRRALLQFLSRFTHEENPFAAAHEPPGRFTPRERHGAELFREHCERCHAARLVANDPATLVPFERWETLVFSPAAPIVWARGDYEKTGVLPYVDRHGAPILVPGGDGLAMLVRPRGGRHPTAQVAWKRLQRQAGIANHRQGTAFVCVMHGDVDLRDFRVGICEQSPGAGREILQPRTDPNDQISLCRRRVRGRGAGDANTAKGQWMIPQDATLTGLGFGHWDTQSRGQPRKYFACIGIMNSAAGDEQGRLRLLQCGGEIIQLARIGCLPPARPSVRIKEIFGKVEGLGLDILAKG